MAPTTLAVLSQSGQALYFHDIFTGQRTGYIENLIAEPHELCHDIKRNLLYISHTYRHGHYWAHGDNSHEISILDVETRKVVGEISTLPARAPHGLVIDETRDLLYVSVEELPGEEGGGIIGIDLSSRRIVKTVGSKFKTHWFVMTPDGNKAYTCNKTAPFISVLDLNNQKMTGTIPVDGCEEPCISPDGRYAYFPTPGMKWGLNPSQPAIQVIDTRTDTIVKSINVDAGMISLHTTVLGSILCAHYHFSPSSTPGEPKYQAATLSMYDPHDYTKIGEVEIGLLPLTIRSSSDGKTAFVANIMPGTVSVVDLTSMNVVRTIDVDQNPRSDKQGHQGAHGMALIS
ncbi:hypothetical protein ES702_01204 [subsurface metagenome]